MRYNAKYHHAYNTARYRSRKAAGLCVCCGRPAGGKTRCPDCMRDQVIYNRKYLMLDEDR